MPITMVKPAVFAHDVAFGGGQRATPRQARQGFGEVGTTRPLRSVARRLKRICNCVVKGRNVSERLRIGRPAARLYRSSEFAIARSISDTRHRSSPLIRATEVEHSLRYIVCGGSCPSL